MIVHYNGPIDRVELPLPSGRTVSVAKGNDLDLSEHLPAAQAREFGKSLTRQEVWTEAKAAAAPKPSDKKED